jgi:hypothetical protein
VAVRPAAFGRRRPGGELLADHEFLVYADPDTVLAALRDRDDPESRLLVAVYRTAYRPQRWGRPCTRRQLLAMEAARFGVGWGFDNPVTTPGAGGWKPLWATGSRVSGTGALDPDRPVNGDGGGLHRAERATGRVTASEDDETVRVWDLTTGTPVGQPQIGRLRLTFTPSLP